MMGARARIIHSPSHKLLKMKSLNHQKALQKSLLVLESTIMRRGRSDSHLLSILEKNQYSARLKSWKSWFFWSSSHVLPHSHKSLLVAHLQPVFSLCMLSWPQYKTNPYQNPSFFVFVCCSSRRNRLRLHLKFVLQPITHDSFCLGYIA